MNRCDFAMLRLGFFAFFMLFPVLSYAESPPEGDDPSCALADRTCILKVIETESGKIETVTWRDQTYRELAKTKAFEGDMPGAVALIQKIKTPDTQAMTIRGIGMAVADIKLPPEERIKVFADLRKQAETISHKPSYAIALTYIAMAQAFAGDNEASWATAASMENIALRHKAYGETAEIQAERGDFAAVQKTLGFVDDPAYRSKAYGVITKILADRNFLDDALKAAMAITNPYQKAVALQYVLDKQKPREIPHQ